MENPDFLAVEDCMLLNHDYMTELHCLVIMYALGV